MKKFLLLCIFVIHAFAYDSTIQIVKNLEKHPRLAVADAGSQNIEEKTKRKLLKLLIGDLKVSAHFNVDDSYVKMDYVSNEGTATLAKSGVELLVKCKFEKHPSGKLMASTKLVNAKNGDLLYEKFYSISKPKRYPFLAHNVAIDVNDYFGAPSISWMKSYIIFARYTKAGESEIVVADYTLTFKKTIVSGGLNIFPKWANAKQDSFYYTSYNALHPTLYHVNIYTGKKKKIAASEGMIVCSDVSQDGNKLLVTMAPNEQPDIYLYDVRSGSKKRLTTYRGIDVGGSFVDSDQNIVFVSERLGYPNVFSKSINGKSVDQMIYHGKNNSSCSTHGKYIVYSSREGQNSFGKNTFNLYLISTQTDYIRKLTTSGKNMFPRFADDGETVVFIKYIGNKSALGVLRLNANKSFLFPLNAGKIQSIDW
ncbi:MAG: Tol-Pal system protein TolB [Epsilonproteobacteria bacterium]|nr:Tol-Pal system protein TolB [Campylobacterota bacterium]